MTAGKSLFWVLVTVVAVASHATGVRAGGEGLKGTDHVLEVSDKGLLADFVIICV